MAQSAEKWSKIMSNIPSVDAKKVQPIKSKLRGVEPKKAEPSKPKILLFGAAGVGKTWGALDFPGVYYIDTEKGADRDHYTDKLVKSGGRYFGPEQGSQDFPTVIAEIEALATENHPYKTLVIDSGTKLFSTAKFLAAEKGGDEYGRDKKEANKPARRLMSWLGRIDMNVIITAHEIPLWGLDSKGERTQIGVTYDAWDKLDYELDLVLNIQKLGASRKARVVKSRLKEFPEASNFDWSYEEFAKKYGKDVIESQGKTLVLATAAQLARYKELMETWKAPDGQEEKWLKAANVSDLSEIDSDKLAKIIEYIETKIKGEK
jgi:hypothetical protein